MTQPAADPDAAPFVGSVAVVVGAASGIGRGIALALARQGARLVLGDINDAGLEPVAALIQAEGGRAQVQRCNAAEQGDVDALIRAAVEGPGPPQILVNSFFNSARKNPEDLALDDWNRVLQVSLTGYFLAAQAAGRAMILAGAGGSIVNISSVAASSGMGRGNLAYSVSKAGINQMTRELAIEWARHGIRVNAVQPCQVQTPGFLSDPTLVANETMQRVTRGIPMGRLAEVDDIVGAALFLASPAASMITGVCLPVDGGNLALNAGGSITW